MESSPTHQSRPAEPGRSPGASKPSTRSKVLGSIRLAAVYAFVAVLVWFSRPTPELFVAGTIIVLAGEAVRIWAAGHLVKSLELIQAGPYAYTQNPLYLGRLLILTGFCVMARSRYGINWTALVAGYLIFFGYYIPRKLRVEGGRLQKMHGDGWVKYNAAVPILLPSLRRYPAPRRPWSLTRLVRNQEPLVVLAVLLVLALFAWKTWAA